MFLVYVFKLSSLQTMWWDPPISAHTEGISGGSIGQSLDPEWKSRKRKELESRSLGTTRPSMWVDLSLTCLSLSKICLVSHFVQPEIYFNRRYILAQVNQIKMEENKKTINSHAVVPDFILHSPVLYGALLNLFGKPIKAIRLNKWMFCVCVVLFVFLQQGCQ